MASTEELESLRSLLGNFMPEGFDHEDPSRIFTESSRLMFEQSQTEAGFLSDQASRLERALSIAGLRQRGSFHEFELPVQLEHRVISHEEAGLPFTDSQRITYINEEPLEPVFLPDINELHGTLDNGSRYSEPKGDRYREDGLTLHPYKEAMLGWDFYVPDTDKVLVASDKQTVTQAFWRHRQLHLSSKNIDRDFNKIEESGREDLDIFYVTRETKADGQIIEYSRPAFHIRYSLDDMFDFIAYDQDGQPIDLDAMDTLDREDHNYFAAGLMLDARLLLDSYTAYLEKLPQAKR